MLVSLELVPTPDAALAAETRATSAADASVTRLRLFIGTSLRMCSPHRKNASSLSAVSLKIVHNSAKSPGGNRAALGNAKARAKLVLPGQCSLRPSAGIEDPWNFCGLCEPIPVNCLLLACVEWERSELPFHCFEILRFWLNRGAIRRQRITDRCHGFLATITSAEIRRSKVRQRGKD